MLIVLLILCFFEISIVGDFILIKKWFKYMFKEFKVAFKNL